MAMLHVKGDGVSTRPGGSRSRAKWWDLGCILEVEMVGFVGVWESKMTSKVLD